MTELPKYWRSLLLKAEKQVELQLPGYHCISSYPDGLVFNNRAGDHRIEFDVSWADGKPIIKPANSSPAAALATPAAAAPAPTPVNERALLEAALQDIERDLQRSKQELQRLSEAQAVRKPQTPTTKPPSPTSAQEHADKKRLRHLLSLSAIGQLVLQEKRSAAPPLPVAPTLPTEQQQAAAKRTKELLGMSDIGKQVLDSRHGTSPTSNR